MTDSMDPLLCGAFLVFLILIDAIQTAYDTSLNGISDSDLMPDEEGNLRIPEPALSRIKEDRENPSKFFRSAMFWQILTAAQGCAALLISLALAS